MYLSNIVNEGDRCRDALGAYLEVVFQKVFSIRIGTDGVMTVQGRIEDVARFGVSTGCDGISKVSFCSKTHKPKMATPD